MCKTMNKCVVFVFFSFMEDHTSVDKHANTDVVLPSRCWYETPGHTGSLYTARLLLCACLSGPYFSKIFVKNIIMSILSLSSSEK